MTDTQAEARILPVTSAVPSERGRYAIYAGNGGAVIGRASGICERCATCGCGTQEEPIDLTPAGIMKLVKDQGFSFSPAAIMKMMRHG